MKLCELNKATIMALVMLSATLFVFLQTTVTTTLTMMVEGAVHYNDFILKEKNFTRACATKTMLVVNEQFPGPTLYVRKGDTMFVNVQNLGNRRVTIHWHGVSQPGNPWSDGPEYITQCPIEPGKNFTYEVIFSSEEGTLWWHAHSDWTRNTVHGAIVIYPADGITTPYPTSHAEQVLILGSWYNYDVNLVVEEVLKNGDDTPISNHYLINGLPGESDGCDQEDTFHWEVDYNETYLLRIVSAVMNAQLFFAIASHNLTVVGIDGTYSKPFVTSYIMIAPGQTIDVLVTMNRSLPEGQYHMVARQYISSAQVGYEYNLSNATAILEYNNATKRIDWDDEIIGVIPADTLPSYSDSASASRFVSEFKSLANESYPIDVPTNITTRMFVTVSMNLMPYNVSGNDTTGPGSSLNNISWSNPEVDILQAYYRNTSNVFTDDFPDEPPSFFNFTDSDLAQDTSYTTRGTKLKMLSYNDQVEIVFQGTNLFQAAEDHPMHFHGHTIYRVGLGAGNFDPANDPSSYNLIDPPAGNTFTVPADGWITIRFKANNPGVWFWHCHYDRHMSWGMDTVFITRNGGTPESTIRDPPSNMPSCDSSSSLISDGHPQFHNSMQKSDWLIPTTSWVNFSNFSYP